MEYDVFTPEQKQTLKQIASQQTKFKGQIFTLAKPGLCQDSTLNLIAIRVPIGLKIDAGIQSYHANNLEAGFFQTVLLKMVGDPDAPSTHPDDKRDRRGRQ